MWYLGSGITQQSNQKSYCIDTNTSQLIGCGSWFIHLYTEKAKHNKKTVTKSLMSVVLHCTSQKNVGLLITSADAWGDYKDCDTEKRQKPSKDNFSINNKYY